MSEDIDFSYSLSFKGSVVLINEANFTMGVLIQNLLLASGNLGITNLRADRPKACLVVSHSQDRPERDHIHSRK